MATPTPKSGTASRIPPGKASNAATRRTSSTSEAPPEPVDPIWLIKGIGITILAALVCGYLSLCLLFYQGQWQLVLHPSRAKPAPPTVAGAPFQIVRFGVDETATPQLSGWLVPSEQSARYAAYTLLYLPGGDGSLADATATLATLHELGINVFAFDYRGYGQSGPARPNQRRMTEDTASAWKYLTVSRALLPSHIVVMGEGVGAALAVDLAAANPDAAAVILQDPRPRVIQAVLKDPRTKGLPVHALFHENFEILAPVANLKTPKLFLLDSESRSAEASDIQRLTAEAAVPKTASTLRSGDFNGPLYREQIVRFLDQYLH